jgi:hypothetical protein
LAMAAVSTDTIMDVDRRLLGMDLSDMVQWVMVSQPVVRLGTVQSLVGQQRMVTDSVAEASTVAVAEAVKSASTARVSSTDGWQRELPAVSTWGSRTNSSARRTEKSFR